MLRIKDINVLHDKVKRAVLLGLKRYGRSKTFSDILDEAGIPHDSMLRFKTAIALDTLGLIQSVSYQLPVTIRAELSPAGYELVNTVQQNRMETR